MKSILIADDDEVTRTILEKALEKEGYRIMTAVNGREAVEKVKEESPDLLILDIRMPDMHGLEVLEVVRKENKALPIVVCSGVGQLRDDFAVLSSNISAFITKPVDVEKLKEKIKEICPISP